MQSIYGILSKDNGHIDISLTLKGAKQYATKNGYDTVTLRHNGGYIVTVAAKKNSKGKWINQ